jgi:polysaccharide biosynthesis protein PslG
VDDAVAHNRSPILILDFGNQFYDNGDAPKSQATIDAYARYVTFVVNYFRGRVSQFEVWNEWNGGMGSLSGKPQTGDTYVPLLKAAYKAIKAANPNATVIGGVVSWTDQSWVDAFAKAGGMDYIDAFSVHPYVLNPYAIKPNYLIPKSPQEVHISQSVANTGQTSANAPAAAAFVPIRGTPESAMQNVDIFKGKIDSLAHGKSIPLYITEMGWPTSATKNGVPEAQVAAYMQRFLLMARARPWIAGVWWYDLLNDGGNANSDLDNFGLLKNPSSPKQAYQALVSIMDVLQSGRATTVSTDANGVTTASGYTSAGKTVKITWLATNQLDAKQSAKAAMTAASASASSSAVTFMPTVTTQ